MVWSYFSKYRLAPWIFGNRDSIRVTGQNSQKPKRPQPKRSQTDKAPNRNGHRPKRPQSETDTNWNGHRPERPQTETVFGRLGFGRFGLCPLWSETYINVGTCPLTFLHPIYSLINTSWHIFNKPALFFYAEPLHWLPGSQPNRLSIHTLLYSHRVEFIICCYTSVYLILHNHRIGYMTNHRLGLDHETMSCAICCTMFL